MTNRRNILIGATGAIAVAAAAPLSARVATTGSGADTAFANTNFIYDYVFIDTVPGAGGSTQKAFVEHVRTLGLHAVRAASGEALGYLTPLIGWTSQQVAIVLRWPTNAPGREQAVTDLTSHPAVRTIERSRLAATVRPAPADLPKTTGIYTHRWFDVKTADVPEFIELSKNAWPYFEGEFDSTVFGLFRADQSADDRARGTTRMLLNTQYSSHAVWEASRKPSSEPTELFHRRNNLTLSTRVASLRFNTLT